MYKRQGVAAPRSIGVRSYGILHALSRDGRLALLDDETTDAGPSYPIYLRRTDGSPPVSLGEGSGGCLSPDGLEVLVVRKEPRGDLLTVFQTAGGAGKPLDAGGLTAASVTWSRTRGILVLARRGGDPPRIWKIAADHPPEAIGPPLPPEAVTFGVPPPAENRALVVSRDGSLYWANLDDAGSPPQKADWSLAGGDADNVAQWGFPGFSADGQWCWVVPDGPPPIRVDRVNLSTGKREHFRTIDLPNVNGWAFVAGVSEDGRTVVLGIGTNLGDVFLLEGLK